VGSVLGFRATARPAREASSANVPRRHDTTMALPQFDGAPPSAPPLTITARIPPRFHRTCTNASHKERTYGELSLHGARCYDVGFVHQRQYWHASFSFATCASDLPLLVARFQSILKARSAAAVSDSLLAAGKDEETVVKEKIDEDLDFDDDDDDDDDSLVQVKKRSTLHPTKHAQNAAGFSDSSSNDDDDDDEGLDDDTSGIPAPRGNRPAGGGAASIKVMRAGEMGHSKPPPGNMASQKLPSGPADAAKPLPPTIRRRTPVLGLNTKVRTRP
jgi:hypothetical protein